MGKKNQNIERKRKAIALGIFALFVCFAGGVYLFVGSAGYIPEFPRVKITPEEQALIMSDLKNRIRAISLSPEEEALVGQLSRLQKLESADDLPVSEKNRLDEALEKFQTETRVLAERSLPRYLLLGDYLAFQFYSKLKDLLRHLNTEHSWQREQARLDLVRQAGGAFLKKAISSGAVTAQGRMNAAEIAPMVLFRVRWRNFARLPLDYGFSEVEKLVYYDFIAAFSAPRALEKRLAAIHEIKKMRPSFDGVLARAAVLHAAGRNAEALEFLEQAVQHGRNDSELRQMARAIKSEID